MKIVADYRALIARVPEKARSLNRAVFQAAGLEPKVLGMIQIRDRIVGLDDGAVQTLAESRGVRLADQVVVLHDVDVVLDQVAAARTLPPGAIERLRTLAVGLPGSDTTEFWAVADHNACPTASLPGADPSPFGHVDRDVDLPAAGLPGDDPTQYGKKS